MTELSPSPDTDLKKGRVVMKKRLGIILAVVLLFQSFACMTFADDGEYAPLALWDMSEIGKDGYSGTETVGSWGTAQTHSFSGGKLVYASELGGNHKIAFTTGKSITEDVYTVKVPVRLSGALETVKFYTQVGDYEVNHCIMYDAGTLYNLKGWVASGVFAVDKDYEFGLVFENPADTNERSQITVYLNGKNMGTFTSNANFRTFGNLRLLVTPKSGSTLYVGNIELCRGNIYDTMDISASASNVFIPPSGKASKISFSSADATESAVWSLTSDRSGVTIDKNSGELTVTGDANPGTVEVKVSDSASGKAPGKMSVELSRIYYDFESGITSSDGSVSDSWFAGTVLEENGNHYIHPAGKFDESHNWVDGDPNVRYRFPDGAYGRIVIEAKIRSNPNNEYSSNYSAVCGTNGSNWVGYIQHRTDSWTDIKAVYDTVNKTRTFLVGGELIGNAEEALSAWKDGEVLKYFYSEWDLDDVRIYTADTQAPSVFGVKIISADGVKVKADYEYFSVSGLEEMCSEYAWYVSDTADAPESERRPIENAFDAQYSVSTEYAGKYLWVKVTPASGSSLTGIPVWSDAYEVKPVTATEKITVNGIDVSRDGASLAAGKNVLNYEIAITNFENKPVTLMLLGAAKNDGVLISSDVDVVTVNPSESVTLKANIDADISIPEGASDEEINAAKEKVNAKFYLWKASCAPYDGYETLVIN